MGVQSYREGVTDADCCIQAAIEQDSGREGAALKAVLQIDATIQNSTCKHCNQKKLKAKQAQEASDKIFMCARSVTQLAAAMPPPSELTARPPLLTAPTHTKCPDARA